MIFLLPKYFYQICYCSWLNTMHYLFALFLFSCCCCRCCYCCCYFTCIIHNHTKWYIHSWIEIYIFTCFLSFWKMQNMLFCVSNSQHVNQPWMYPRTQMYLKIKTHWFIGFSVCTFVVHTFVVWTFVENAYLRSSTCNNVIDHFALLTFLINQY